MMNESAYQHLADATFRRIEAAFADVDAEDVDFERAGDVLTLTFKGGKKCIVNTQRPTRQIWLAANARAWHFDWDAGAERWLDDKGGKNADGSRIELLGTVKKVVAEASGLQIELA